MAPFQGLFITIPKRNNKTTFEGFYDITKTNYLRLLFGCTNETDQFIAIVNGDVRRNVDIYKYKCGR